MDVGFSALITMYMIMVGPIKLILPFAHATANADRPLRRKIALKTTLWGGGVAVICLLLGDFVVEKFLLSEGTLMIAISLFLAAFAYSLAHAGDPARTKGASPPPEAPTTELAVIPLAFPGVIPPQGFGLLVLSTQHRLLRCTIRRVVDVDGAYRRYHDRKLPVHDRSTAHSESHRPHVLAPARSLFVTVVRSRVHSHLPHGTAGVRCLRESFPSTGNCSAHGNRSGAIK